MPELIKERVQQIHEHCKLTVKISLWLVLAKMAGWSAKERFRQPLHMVKVSLWLTLTCL